MQYAKSGFSMIELMVGLVIIILIMSFVGPRIMKVFFKGEYAATKNSLMQLDAAIQEYRMGTGKYPSTLQDLINKPEGIRGWGGPYVEETELTDRWDQPIVYALKEPGSKPPYELYSQGNPDDGKVIYANE